MCNLWSFPVLVIAGTLLQADVHFHDVKIGKKLQRVFFTPLFLYFPSDMWRKQLKSVTGVSSMDLYSRNKSIVQPCV